MSALRTKQPFEFYMWAGLLATLSQPGHILMYVPLPPSCILNYVGYKEQGIPE